MLVEQSTLHGSTAVHSTEKKIDATTWGLLLLMIGVLLLLPSDSVPEGAWLILSGIILLGACVVRYATRLRVSAFIVALGLLALAAGVSAVAGMDLPLFAVFLVLLGASVILRSWFVQSDA